MTATQTDRIEVSPNALFQDLDDEAVLLDLASERYYGLDDIGMRFWQLLEAYGNTSDVVAQALVEFDVDETALRHDLAVLLSELEDAGLVTVSGK